MNFRIVKLKTSKKGDERHEVRAWDGKGENRVEWRRRFDSRADAQNFIDDHIFKDRESKLEIRRNGADPMSTRTFAEEHEFWSKCKRPDLSPSYQLDVAAYWRELEPHVGSKIIADVRPQLIREIEAGMKEKGNSRATIKRKIVWLKSVLNFAVENERISFNPIARVRTAKPTKPDMKFWEADEASAFLSYARIKYPLGSDHEQIYLAYLTTLNTALRAGELWALKPRCLKDSLRQIVISEQFDLRAKCFRQLKGKESRSVPLQPALAEALH
jgi:integrase